MARQTETSSSSIVGNLIKGALAGAAGVMALDFVSEMWTQSESKQTLEQEGRARPDAMDPAHVLANRAAEAAGYDLEPAQPHSAGIATHYALGILPTAISAASRRRYGFNLGRGLLMGVGMFAVQDEGLNYVLGLSGPPNEYPWQAHARGLVAHLAYGLVSEGTLTLLDTATNQAGEASSRAKRQIEKLRESRTKRRAKRPSERQSEQRRHRT